MNTLHTDTLRRVQSHLAHFQEHDEWPEGFCAADIYDDVSAALVDAPPEPTTAMINAGLKACAYVRGMDASNVAILWRAMQEAAAK